MHLNNNNKRKISLSVKRSAFRSDDPSSEEADKEFQLVRRSVLTRDSNTCQYCGFTADKYQEVHHIDDNHSNNSEDNLITICALCHSCFHIGLSGTFNRGDIIRLDPKLNISQAELNQLVRVLWIAEESTEQSIKMISVKNLARLANQKVSAIRKLGTSDPLVVGDWLLQLSDEDYSQRDLALSEYYFLPKKSGYGPQFNHWSSNSFKNIPSSDWLEVSEQKLRSWSNNKYGNDSNESIISVLTHDQ
ncbi:type IVB secretion system protein IcmJDotN [Psychromonas sp. SP041]|uniref:type IVB secretion system protein IcmJDotN n=1 Tax=Psychromonas sp. SP041 TaxID=1365007 RepID=UPI0010C77786|nr:type IVB secretion system protein IcmJDotN [Psychromonas sp. SP041]